MEPRQEPTLACDLCGRSFPQHALQEHRGQLLCDDCLLEEEACGCGDNDPPE